MDKGEGALWTSGNFLSMLILWNSIFTAHTAGVGGEGCGQ